MAKKFDTVKTNASKVAKAEAEKGTKVVIENIAIADLVYDPKNGEDLKDIADLVGSIEKNGFVGSIVVTEYGCEKGKYRIVSGHRRTEAMKALKMTHIPAQIQHYESEEKVALARIAMNTATRDSEKNPLLMVNRWINFSESVKMKAGEMTKEFAKISGLSASHIERLKSTAKVITEIRNLALHEDMGGYDLAVSAISTYGALKEDVQREIWENVLKVAIEDGKVGLLNRDNLVEIKNLYTKDGLKTWAEIYDRLVGKAEVSHGENTDDTANDFMNVPESTEDTAEADEADDTASTSENTSDDTSDKEDDLEGVDAESAKASKKAKELSKTVSKLDDLIEREFYEFNDDEEANNAITNMLSLSIHLLNRATEIASKTDGGDETIRMARLNFKHDLADYFNNDGSDEALGKFIAEHLEKANFKK